MGDSVRDYLCKVGIRSIPLPRPSKTVLRVVKTI